jgi:hypothetical protein
VGPRVGLDTEVRGKIIPPLPGIEPQYPGRPVRSQTLLTELHRLPILKYVKKSAEVSTTLDTSTQGLQTEIQVICVPGRTP